MSHAMLILHKVKSVAFIILKQMHNKFLTYILYMRKLEYEQFVTLLIMDNGQRMDTGWTLDI